GLRDEGVPELPELAVLHRLDEAVAMILRQRLKAGMRAAERYRFKPGHLTFTPFSIPSLRGALATKQSSFLCRFKKTGLLRCARMTLLSSPSSFRDGAPALDPESRDPGFDASHRPGMTIAFDAIVTCSENSTAARAAASPSR